MQIGVSFPQNGVGNDLGAIREFVQTAEDLGYDYIFSGDHVLGADPNGFDGRPGPYTVDYIYHEPFVLFAYMAALTQRIKFFSGVLILPQRPAALVAKQAAELDHLSGGRLMLGVGVGWNTLEYEALGQDFDHRGSRMEEQFEVMRRLWCEDTVTFEGRWHQVHNSGLNPRPVQQPVPLWIGGLAEPVLKRTGRIADGWISATDPGVNATPQVIREPWDRVRNYARETGRDPSTLGLHVGAGGGTPDEIRQRLDEWQAIGATHATTGARNIPDAKGQIEAIRRFKEALA
jgi:probable F420-dependent oxidoreductase